MTVKRYGSVLFDTGLIEMACGDYVTYSDYQKLVAECDDFKKSAEYSAATNKKIVAINIRLSDENTDLKSDAAIAEIKAQGVDEFAKQWGSEYYPIGEEAEKFAANLRAGRNF